MGAGAFLLGGRIDLGSAGAIGILIYLAFLSAIAYSLWGVLLKFNPVSKVTVFNFMIPVFGAFLSEIFFPGAGGVALSNLIIALILICIGILLINLKKEEK